MQWATQDRLEPRLDLDLDLGVRLRRCLEVRTTVGHKNKPSLSSALAESFGRDMSYKRQADTNETYIP